MAKRSVFPDEPLKEEAEFDYEEWISDFYNPSKVIVKNSILEATAEQIKFALLRRLKDSIWVSGMESSGRRTAVEYTAELLKEEANLLPNQLKGIAFLQVVFPEDVETATEVAEFLVKGLAKYYEAGENKLVLFMGNLNDVPISFQTDYFFIKEELKEAGIEFIKFISIFDEDPNFDDCDMFHQEDEVSDYEITKDSYIILMIWSLIIFR